MQLAVASRLDCDLPNVSGWLLGSVLPLVLPNTKLPRTRCSNLVPVAPNDSLLLMLRSSSHHSEVSADRYSASSSLETELGFPRARNRLSHLATNCDTFGASQQPQRLLLMRAPCPLRLLRILIWIRRLLLPLQQLFGGWRLPVVESAEIHRSPCQTPRRTWWLLSRRSPNFPT